MAQQHRLVTISSLLGEPEVIIAIALGILTSAIMLYKALLGGAKPNKQNKFTIRHFFQGPGENGAGVSPYIPMTVIAKRDLTHDTILLRFALDKAVNYKNNQMAGMDGNKLVVAGVGPGKHIQIRATIDGEVVNRSYSPVSNDFEEACNGLLDVVVKVYHGPENPGLMTTRYLNKLSPGDLVEMRGATGMIEYRGCGEFVKGGKPIVIPGFGPSTPSRFGGTVARHIVLIGGGSGVTPCLAILKAIMSSKCPRAVVTHRDHWSQETHPPSSPMSPSVALKEFSKGDIHSMEPRLESIFNATCAPVFGGKGCSATSPSSNDPVTAVTFLICNHTCEDILGREWLQHVAFPALAQASKEATSAACVLPGGVRFIFFNSRSDPEEKASMKSINKDWASEGFASAEATMQYESGRISASALAKYVPRGDDAAARPFVVLCGPDGLLNNTCKPALLNNLAYTKEQLLVV